MKMKNKNWKECEKGRCKKTEEKAIKRIGNIKIKKIKANE